MIKHSKRFFLALILLATVAALQVVCTPHTSFAKCGSVETALIQCDTGGSNNGIWALLLIVVNLLAAGIGIAAVGGIVYAALLYTSASDDSGQISKAKGMITNVVIGIVGFALLYSFLQYIIPGGFMNSLTSPPKVADAPKDPEPPKNVNTNGSGANSGSQEQDTSSFKPGQVLIIGDSITARPATGDNRGYKGWWQYLLDGKKGMFKFSAQGGSGYTKPGLGGSRTTFYQRLGDIDRIKPKAIIIAGGLNDRTVPKSTWSKGIPKYYTQLAKVLKRNNIPTSNVYVFVPHPYGTVENTIIPVIRSNAKRIGVQYIDAGGYPRSEAYASNHLHPNSTGAKRVEKDFLAGSNFGDRLKSSK